VRHAEQRREDIELAAGYQRSRCGQNGGGHTDGVTGPRGGPSRRVAIGGEQAPAENGAEVEHDPGQTARVHAAPAEYSSWVRGAKPNSSRPRLTISSGGLRP